MLGKLFQVHRITRSVKSGALGFMPLDVSARRDRETFRSIWLGSNADAAPVERTISEDQRMFLWRLYHYQFSNASLIRTGYGRYVSTINMVLCAVSSHGNPTDIRFQYAYSESGRVSPISNEVYAVNLHSRQVFELRGSHYKYWDSPEQALVTLFTKPEWWRDWCDEDKRISDAAFENRFPEITKYE